MFTIKIKINQLEYDSLIKLGMSFARNKLQNINFEPFTKDAVDEFLNTDDSRIKDAFNVIPDSLKTVLVLKAFSFGKDKLLSFINLFAESQNISMKLCDILIDNENTESDFLITCSINEIDYNGLIKKILPLIHLPQKDQENEMNRFLNAVISALIAENESVESIFNAIDKNLRDEFVVYLVTAYSEQITTAISNVLYKMGIVLNIEYLNIEVSKGCK